MDFPISRTRFTFYYLEYRYYHPDGDSEDDDDDFDMEAEAVYEKDGVRVKIDITTRSLSTKWDIKSINYKDPKEYLILLYVNYPNWERQGWMTFTKKGTVVREATKEQHGKMLAMKKLYFYLLNR